MTKEQIEIEKIKSAIKTILDLRGTISFPHKSKMDEWFGTVSILKLHNEYHITGISSSTSFEETFNKFKNLLNNVGLMQSIVQEEHPEIDPEEDWEQIKKLVKEKRRK